MKNVCSGSKFWKWIPAFACPKALVGAGMTMLVFLPQAPVMADQASVTAACNKIEDPESEAFFHNQAEERGAFMKANPDAIARHDKHFAAILALDMARRTGKSTAGLGAVPDEDPVFAAFQQKQASDKEAFLTKFYQERRACLNGQPASTNSQPASTNPSGT